MPLAIWNRCTVATYLPLAVVAYIRDVTKNTK